MITIWVPKRLVEVGLYNVAARSPQELVELSEQTYRERLVYAAQKIRQSSAKIVMLTGPSASGKTTTAHRLAEELVRGGTPAQVASLDNFFLGAENYPLMPDGTRDYESPDALDMPLVVQCLQELCRDGHTMLPIYDFKRECRADETEPIDLKGGVCIIEGIHALNPALTGLIPKQDVYRVYAGLREEYSRQGRRAISTRDIRLCRRMLRDAAARGHNPEKTLSMWDRVLDGETRYIKGFKNTADFLLDTSFTSELGIISGLLEQAGHMLSPDSRFLEQWDETARRFEDVTPIDVALLPPNSMLHEFYE
jgi:uridine kinase